MKLKTHYLWMRAALGWGALLTMVLDAYLAVAQFPVRLGSAGQEYGKCAALLETRNDVLAAGKLGHIVARRRMRLHRQDLAVDAECTDAVARAKLQRGEQRVGITQAQLCQSC